jgi:hypothetical protein
MLETRRGYGGLSIERVSRRPAGRLLRTLARFGRPDEVVPHGTPRPAGSTAAAGAYLALAGTAGIAGTAARLCAYPVMVGGIAALALAVGAHALVRSARSRVDARRLVLRSADSEPLFAVAVRMATDILAVWPAVADVVGVADPRPLLEDAVWDIGRRLVLREWDRERLVAQYPHGAALPPGSSLAAESASQFQQALECVRGRERELAGRLRELRRLARACRDFQRFRQPVAPNPGGVAELAGRAESVVAAYRQLLTG